MVAVRFNNSLPRKQCNIANVLDDSGFVKDDSDEIFPVEGPVAIAEDDPQLRPLTRQTHLPCHTKSKAV